MEDRRSSKDQMESVDKVELNGRCTVHVGEDGAFPRFEGKFSNGLQHGRGNLFFEDGSILEGVWNFGELHGKGTYLFPDGSYLKGSWVNGELNGVVHEYAFIDTKGLVLVFEGEYVNGVRHGHGELLLDDGGRIVGTWKDGKINGKGIKYFYPGDAEVSYIKGDWKNGDMKKGIYVYKGVPLELLYKYDPSSSKMISSDPLLPDPFEEKRVYVKESTIPSAGQGLFAKRDFSEGDVCSFYNGVRLSHNVVDSRTWDSNANCISLDEISVIDVPPEWNELKSYKASLGHKSNHSFANQNAEYALYWHPRFGHIKCIRAIRDISKGDEIFVHYTYAPRTGPKWYRHFERL